MADAAEDSHPADFDGLYQTDAVDLAARAFRRVFAGATMADPMRELDKVDRAIAKLGGVDVYSGLFGTAKTELWHQVQPYTLEVVLVWEQARVAARRTTAGQYGVAYVYLLRRGEQLLQATDPVSALQGYLPGMDLR